MFLDAFTIQIKNLFAHSCFKMKHYPLPFCFSGEDKVLTIPGRTLIIAASSFPVAGDKSIISIRDGVFSEAKSGEQKL